MQITRYADAKPYQTNRHYNMVGLQLQGNAASTTEAFTCGLSLFQPGGGAEMSSSLAEKIYIVLEGEIVVCTEAGEFTLGPLDSCHLAPNEARAIENRNNTVAISSPRSLRRVRGRLHCPIFHKACGKRRSPPFLGS